MVDQRNISPKKERWDSPLSPRKEPRKYIYVKNPVYMERQGEKKDHDEVINEEREGENWIEDTFGFPILDTMQDATMKNIPPSSLPNFYGKSNEDPETFLFEFDILCRSYNYLQDCHKLKIFLATLKDSALRWFMGLGESTIRTWDDMKTSFLRKYQE